MNIIQRFLSVVNDETKTYKIIHILGFKIKIRQDRKILEKLIERESAKLSSKLDSIIVNIRASQEHPNTFGQYKNINMGKDVVLICGGPTIKSFLPIKNAVYVAVNDCCKWDKVDFDYVFIQELHKEESKNITVDAYKSDKCVKFYGIIPDNRLAQIYPLVRRIPQSLVNSNNIKQYWLDDRWAYKFAYDLNTEPIGEFGGTAFSAMQFILWTNPKRIFLVGVDCTNNGHAFNNAIVSLAADWHIRCWKNLKTFVDDIYPQTQVISINPVGLKGVFEDYYTQDYIDQHPNVKEELGDNIKILGKEFYE